MTKVVTCDRCGVQGREHKRDSGPNVAEVKVGLHNGGRIIDLCGTCRTAFSAVVNEWLGAGCAEVSACGNSTPQPGSLDALRVAVNDYLLAQNSGGYKDGGSGAEGARIRLCQTVYPLNAAARLDSFSVERASGPGGAAAGGTGGAEDLGGDPGGVARSGGGSDGD